MSLDGGQHAKDVRPLNEPGERQTPCPAFWPQTYNDLGVEF